MSSNGESKKPEWVIDIWEEKNSFEGCWGRPRRVSVGPSGLVYVANTHYIQCFDSKGTAIHKWGGPTENKEEDGKFDAIGDIVAGVRRGSSTSVQRAMMDVPQLASFPPGVAPICVEYVGEECLYVTNQLSHCVQMFRYDGTFIRRWGKEGTGDGQFQFPFGCSMGRTDGLLYVVDVGNHRIQVFDECGQFVRKFGTMGKERTQFQMPFCVSADTSDGSVLVADTGNNRLVRWSGENETSIYAYRPASVDFTLSHDEKTLYVAHCYDNKIYNIAFDGTIIRTFGETGNSCGQFNHPLAMTKGLEEGQFYVADSNNSRVVVIRVAPCTG